MTIRNPGFDFNALMAGTNAALGDNRIDDAIRGITEITENTADWNYLDQAFQAAQRLPVSEERTALTEKLVTKMDNANRSAVGALAFSPR